MRYKSKSSHICDKCGRIFMYEKLNDILDEHQRPSKPEPSGECPRCGAFCYPKEKVNAQGLPSHRACDD